MKEGPVCKICADEGRMPFDIWRKGILAVTAIAGYDREKSRRAHLFPSNLPYDKRWGEKSVEKYSILNYVIPPAKPIPKCMLCDRRNGEYRW